MELCFKVKQSYVSEMNTNTVNIFTHTHTHTQNAHSTNALCTAFTYLFLSVTVRRHLSLPLMLLGASAAVTLRREKLLQIVSTFNKKSSFKITYVCDNEHDVKYR